MGKRHKQRLFYFISFIHILNTSSAESKTKLGVNNDKSKSDDVLSPISFKIQQVSSSKKIEESEFVDDSPSLSTARSLICVRWSRFGCEMLWVKY